MDSAANPYLAYALLLGAGLKGIENGYDLPAETEDDVWSLTDLERKAMGIESLPQSLDHAIRKLESSELAAEVLGESVFSFVLANKRNEWAEYRSQVTPFEIEQNLRTL
jgi:glutamine synthetase